MVYTQYNGLASGPIIHLMGSLAGPINADEVGSQIRHRNNGNMNEYIIDYPSLEAGKTHADNPGGVNVVTESLKNWSLPLYLTPPGC